MKKLLAATVAAATAALPLAFASPASAAPIELTIVDGYHYNAGGDPLEQYVCLDGELLVPVADANTILFAEVEPGTYTITRYWGDSDDCSADPAATNEVTITDAPAQTLFLHWTDFEDDGTFATVFEDDTSCVASGQGRVIFRNGAVYGDGGPADLVGGGAALVAGVPIAGEGQADLDAATYADVAIAYGTDDFPVDGDLPLEEGMVVAVFAYGGADGAVGAMAYDYQVEVCEEPTTTTAVETTTTVATPGPATPAPAPAQPIRGQASYTG